MMLRWSRYAVLAVSLMLGGVQAATPDAVALLDKPSASQLLRADQYKRPTLVVLWSTECSYCKRNLQWLKQTSARNPKFDVVTVATEPMSPAVTQVLNQLNLKAQHKAYGNELPEALAYAIDADWAGELPRSYAFDGRGSRQVLSGVLTDRIIEAAFKGQPQRKAP